MKSRYLDGINLKLPGIYLINNLLDGKYYIGGSSDKLGLKKRFSKHLYELKKGIHVNVHLQRAFNRDGQNNFEFVGIINTEKGEVLLVEQYLLDILKPYKEDIGYNLQPHSINLKYQNKDQSFNKMKQRNTGIKIRTLLNPDNEIIVIENLKIFCKENNYNLRSFQSLVCGQIESCKGWRLYKGEVPKNKAKIYKNKIAYDVVNTEGKRFVGENYLELCNVFNLDKNSIYQLVTRRCKCYKGWVNHDNYLSGYRPIIVNKIKNKFCG